MIAINPGEAPSERRWRSTLIFPWRGTIRRGLSALSSVSLFVALAAVGGCELFSDDETPAVVEPGLESTWGRIARTQVLRVVCVNQKPFCYGGGKGAGSRQGFVPAMAEDLASALGARVAYVHADRVAGIIAIEDDQAEIHFALQKTSGRQYKIEYAGPLYHLTWGLLLRKGFAGGNTWADYDSPSIRIAVLSNSALESVADSWTGSATRRVFDRYLDALDSVREGRADAIAVTIINGFVLKAVNDDFGALVIPSPILYLRPIFAGLTHEDDGRFKDFVDDWAAKNRDTARPETWIREALTEIGVDESDMPAAFDS